MEELTSLKQLATPNAVIQMRHVYHRFLKAAYLQYHLQKHISIHWRSSYSLFPLTAQATHLYEGPGQASRREKELGTCVDHHRLVIQLHDHACRDRHLEQNLGRLGHDL